MRPDRPDNLEEQLSAYLDGELSDAERAAVEAYLAEDEVARRTLADLRRAAGLLRTLPRAKAPDGLLELVCAQLERQELLGESAASPAAGPRRGRVVGRWLASAAVLAMATTAGYLTFEHLRTEPAGKRATPLGPIADAEGRRGQEAAPPRELHEKGLVTFDPKDRAQTFKGKSGETSEQLASAPRTVEKDAVADSVAGTPMPPAAPAAPAPPPAMTREGPALAATEKTAEQQAAPGAAMRGMESSATRVAGVGLEVTRIAAPPATQPASAPEAGRLAMGEKDVSVAKGGLAGVARAEDAVRLSSLSPDASLTTAVAARQQSRGAAASAPAPGEALAHHRDVASVVETRDAADGDELRVRLVYGDAVARDAAASGLVERLRRHPYVAANAYAMYGDAKAAPITMEGKRPAGFDQARCGPTADSAAREIVIAGSAVAVDLAMQALPQVTPAAGLQSVTVAGDAVDRLTVVSTCGGDGLWEGERVMKSWLAATREQVAPTLSAREAEPEDRSVEHMPGHILAKARGGPDLVKAAPASSTPKRGAPPTLRSNGPDAASEHAEPARSLQRSADLARAPAAANVPVYPRGRTQPAPRSEPVLGMVEPKATATCPTASQRVTATSSHTQPATRSAARPVSPGPPWTRLRILLESASPSGPAEATTTRPARPQ